MSTHSMNESTVPAQMPTSKVTGSAWRGALIGLIPLGLLIVFVAITVLLTALARQFFAESGFFAQQQAALIALIAGLVLAIAVFAITIWRVMRQVAAWQQAKIVVQANAALLALIATALVVVIPILLAVLLPQHPFP
jgi:hypothetical protein